MKSLNLNEFKIFIDTCALLMPQSEKMLTNLAEELRQAHVPAFIDVHVYMELRKKTESEDLALAQRAKRILVRIKALVEEGVLELRGDKIDRDEIFADNPLLTVFTRYRIKYNLLLITQDENLGLDILDRQLDRSVQKIQKIRVLNLDENGNLVEFVPDEPPLSRFGPFSEPLTSTPVEPLDVSYIPHAGKKVQKGGYFKNKKKIRLGRKIAEGTEGCIYEVSSKYAAKIFHKSHITKRKYEKIKALISRGLYLPGLCAPLDLLYNSESEFVGYLMPRALGVELRRSLFIRPNFEKYFPDWTRLDCVNLCITLLKQLEFLHSRGILLGDLNPGNIVVNSPTDVYLVDLDSAQVGGYPCQTGTVTFTAPEIQGKSFANFLRSPGNENFAIATLLFMIMLPGKTPYSQNGGGSLGENICRGNFSFPLGPLSNQHTPDGPWRFLWSHMPYFVKSDFYNTFRFGRANASENTRFSVSHWLNTFTSYRNLLECGALVKQDPASIQIFPTRLKHVNSTTIKQNYKKCYLNEVNNYESKIC